MSHDFLNPEEKEFEDEIQKYNIGLKNTNFQGLQTDLRKNIKNSKLEDKKVQTYLMNFQIYGLKIFKKGL